MILIDKPYFMKNKSWYYFNYKNDKFELTQKAPKEAIKSYKDFYLIMNINYQR